MIVNAEIMFAIFELRLAWTVNEEKVYDKLEKEKYIYQELNTICLKQEEYQRLMYNRVLTTK